MAIPKHVQALANHKGAAIVHAGGMLIPVKIMDISHEETPRSSETAFKCLVVNPEQLSTVELTKAAKAVTSGAASLAAGLREGLRSEIMTAPATYRKSVNPFDIDRVIFNNPATIVFWKDGTKTVVKCQEGDTYSPESGLAIAIAKKALGNKSNFNDVFKKHISNY